jgi:CRISPR/Cas system CSM-associated protein Csm3 (group 7 of RAMP superfamily)
MTILEVKLTPKTWIKAPLAMKEQVKRYLAKGWIPRDYESLDRVFPRTSDGKPFIPKIWFEAAMVRAAKILGVDTRFARDGWRIVEKIGEKYLPVNYVEIPEQPLVYMRTIAGVKQSMEVFEYIDGTFTLPFHVEIDEKDLDKFMATLKVAGELGMMSMTKKGYGKFTCEVGILSEEEPTKKRRAKES